MHGSRMMLTACVLVALNILPMVANVEAGGPIIKILTGACKPPPRIRNGLIVEVSATSRTYTCNEGYEAFPDSDTLERECVDGEWGPFACICEASIATYAPKGCYADSATLLTGDTKEFDANINTNQLCAQWCCGLGFEFSGTQDDTCKCGDSFDDTLTPLTGATDCNTSCPGAGSENCGGTNQFTINGPSTQ